ncbi:hypothetical protein D3C72_672900 [compost metagenome]
MNWVLTRFSKPILFLLVFLCSSIPYMSAQDARPVKVLFLLDGSSSMLDNWQPNIPRFTAASSIILRVVDSIQKVNPSVEFAVRVFGHQYPSMEKNCYDTRLEVPFSARNLEQIRARLRYISARGVSPIAWSLEQAAESDFVNSDRYAYSIILVTDGGESCGGNVCETVQKLLSDRITFKPYILSLVDYAALKGEYDCFGKFLTVANPNQIGPAVKTIVEDNKLMFERNDGNLVKTRMETPVDTTGRNHGPTELVNPDAAKRAALEKMLIYLKVPTGSSQISPIPSKWFNKMAIQTKAIKPPVAKASAYKPTWPKLILPDDEPAPPVAVSHSVMPLIELKRLNLKRSNTKLVKAKAVASRIKPFWTKINFVGAEEPLPQVALIGIKPLPRIKRIPNLIVFPEAKPTRLIAKMVKIKFAQEEPQPVVLAPKPQPVQQQPAPQPKKATPPAVKEDAPVTVVSQKSEETKVLVYFTNGKGKFYKTEPKIDFYDVNAKKVVQSSFRLVNKTTGEPEPIKIQPGTYQITKPGTYFKSSTVKIEANTTDKIIVTVSSGSIKFQYKGNKDRPVKEYTALVSNRFEVMPVVKQSCDELLEYEPGRYHVEINTLPITMAYIPELNFMQTHIIEIPEPGTMQITNAGFRGKVQFHYLHGNNYEPFYDMELNGKPQDQKAEFLPGLYRVYFFKDGEEQIKEFQIFTKKTTNVEL